MTTEPTKSGEVFYSYAHEDEGLRDELKKHLANLKRQGIITDWYDRDISGGKEWHDEIKKHLDSASVILPVAGGWKAWKESGAPTESH